MKEWFSVQELLDLRLPGLPASLTAMKRLVEEAGWKNDLERARQFDGKTKPVWRFHRSALPHSAQVRLAVIVGADEARQETREKRKRLYWVQWEAMTDDQRAVCHARHNVLVAVETALLERQASDTPEDTKSVLARVLGAHKTPVSTYYEWRKLVSDVDQEDWLPALAPKYVEDGVVRDRAECHPDAWAALKSDYLRPEAPRFSACYRRVTEAAKKKGWAPIPSERSLRRRLDAEVEKSVQVYTREGKKKAEQLYPPQVRTKDHLHAMEIANTDGHQLDLFVWAPWNKKSPVRVILLGIQDIYSGKVLSWRLASAETWDVVRACIGDMIEDFGIPEHFYMDNGRAFASKAISGGAAHRNLFRKKASTKANRFGIDEEEMSGILKNFGIEPHFTKVYHGQSKPIERAWRDLAEEISKHPAMSGCYTGPNTNAKPENYRSRAIPLDVLQAHVAERIAEHNARTGRKSHTAKGRSFDATFEESMAHPGTIVRRATEAQRDFWMLAEKVVQVRKNRGEIHYLKNIYWSNDLTAWSGKKVKIRFDPDRLHDPIKVYEPNGRLICAAPCTEKGRFNDVEAAHIHNRNRRTFVKLQKAQADMHRILSADELADLYSASEPDAPKKPIRPAVTRIVAGNLAVEADTDVMTDEEFEAGISRSLSQLSGVSSIIPFPKGNTGRAGIASGRTKRAEK
ncbi:transposase domain-containing protein [Rhizobium sp. YJ-22]|uniref:transposase domain-containing protein n=1 Tax=Rhizobium sp. YJ-22 TaxID=3037556 RepID=UPI00241279D5|nr:transposase domain-containing protein [Rhizobium sp. YJ-22]MDG3576007.1 transposase domain-containing protein [Rhizobium sp. YJ-22]